MPSSCRSLDNHQASALVVDLAGCDYLDSTFLGCLVDLHKHYGMRQPSRFTVVAPPEAAHRLLGPTHLDRFLHIADAVPETIGNAVELPREVLGPDDLGRHLLDCHRRLAEVEGPNQAIFQRIADRLATELEAKQAAPGS